MVMDWGKKYRTIYLTKLTWNSSMDGKICASGKLRKLDTIKIN